MKKFAFINYFVAILAVALLAVSCSKDKDEVGGQDQLIGKWGLTYTQGYEKENGEIYSEWDKEVSGWSESDSWYYEIEFKSNGTFEEYRSEDETPTTGTWVKSGSTLKKKYSGDEDDEIVELKISKLTATELIIITEESFVEDGDKFELYDKEEFKKI